MVSRRFAAVCTAALLLAAAPPASGQQKPAETPKGTGNPPLTNVTRAAWYNIRELVTLAAEKMPDEHYAFKPVPEVRTFGEIVAHLTADHFMICGAVTGQKPPEQNFSKLKKGELVKALHQSTALCDLAMSLLTDDNANFRYRLWQAEYNRLMLLTIAVTHDSEHYGNLVTYMRLKGLVPPSSVPAR